MLLNAYFQAPETENVVVDPPLEYLKRLEDAGDLQDSVGLII